MQLVVHVCLWSINAMYSYMMSFIKPMKPMWLLHNLCMQDMCTDIKIKEEGVTKPTHYMPLSINVVVVLVVASCFSFNGARLPIPHNTGIFEAHDHDVQRVDLCCDHIAFISGVASYLSLCYSN